MGRKARGKRERSAAERKPSDAQARSGLGARRIALVVTACLVGALALAAGLVALLSRPPSPAPVEGAADPLAAAAAGVHFHSTMNRDVGVIETRSASAELPPLNPSLLPVGSEAPDFTLQTPSGATVRLSDYRGKAVLLEFFATWCPHCQAEASHLVHLTESLPASTYATISVNADGEDAASVYAFDRYFGIPYPTLLDPSSRPGSFNQQGAPGPVSLRYEAGVFPTFYVIDRDGRIVWRSDREQPDAALLRELRIAAGA